MAEAAERTKMEAAGRKRAGLRDISEFRRYFHRNEDPIYFVSATNFNLLGLELDRARRLGLNPVTETAQGAVGRERSAYAGRQRVEDRVPVKSEDCWKNGAGSAVLTSGSVG